MNGEVKYRIMHREGATPAFSIDADTGIELYFITLFLINNHEFIFMRFFLHRDL